MGASASVEDDERATARIALEEKMRAPTEGLFGSQENAAGALASERSTAAV